MSSPTYSAADIVDKTLIAKKQLAVYDYPDATYPPIGYVAAGQPVGIVYSWVGGGDSTGARDLWWVFYPDGSGRYYYAPHKEGDFDLSALAAQGVVSLEQKQADAEFQNLPVVERYVRKYGPWLLFAVLGAAAIKGYLSRPSRNTNTN